MVDLSQLAILPEQPRFGCTIWDPVRFLRGASDIEVTVPSSLAQVRRATAWNHSFTVAMLQQSSLAFELFDKEGKTLCASGISWDTFNRDEAEIVGAGLPSTCVM